VNFNEFYFCTNLNDFTFAVNLQDGQLHSQFNEKRPQLQNSVVVLDVYFARMPIDRALLGIFRLRNTFAQQFVGLY